MYKHLWACLALYLPHGTDSKQASDYIAIFLSLIKLWFLKTKCQNLICALDEEFFTI